MVLNTFHCPVCLRSNYKTHTTYTVNHDEERNIYHCQECGNYFSETKNTPFSVLRKPLSFITMVLDAINEGMGINAACRTFGTTKKSIKRWLERLGGLKETERLYALCQSFLQQIIEGDELYTKIYDHKPPSESEGWTIVYLSRASRFIWELSCGEKDAELFQNAIETLIQVIEQTEDLSIVTDGERRYGNLLFDICQEVVKTGKPGRPKKTLKKGVKVQLKNKGSQAHQVGRKRPKYEAPHQEHPETKPLLDNEEVHANHVEAFNSSSQRKIASYRRKTNTYCKGKKDLQRRLDAYWVLHNFVRTHFTIKQVPAVAIGFLKQKLSLGELFRIQSLNEAPA